MSIFVATDQWVNSLLSYFGLNGTKIRIGQNAGSSNQSANSIVINATGTTIDGSGGANRCYIAPIRNDTTKQSQVQYNTTTNEVSYVAQVVSPITTSGLDLTGNAALLSNNSGGSSGQHLQIVVNGTPYKIALLNP